MENYGLSILLILLFSSCQKGDFQQRLGEIDCAEVDCMIADDFYGSGLLNGECWTTRFVGIGPFPGRDLDIILGDPEVNGHRGELHLTFDKTTTDLQDTIWLGRQPTGHGPSNSGTAQYIYWEDHTPVGRFKFILNAPFTYDDYLLIDSYNIDTSILSGRFNLRFTERDVSSFVHHAPDSMNIKCGSFRVEEF
ncbi:MAG: hypothetical protein AAFY76_01650 [Cyanobacteria bacterium J06649_11]